MLLAKYVIDISAFCQQVCLAAPRQSTAMIEKLISHMSHPLKQHTAPSVTPPLMVPPLRRQRELCLATLQQSRERIIR